MKRYEVKPGCEIRGMMVRLYPDKETEVRLVSLESDARRVWNWLVRQTEDVLAARAAFAVREGLTPPRPIYNKESIDASEEERARHIHALYEWHNAVRTATKDVPQCRYRTIKELMIHFKCAHDYQLLQKVDGWLEGDKLISGGAYFYQALMKNYFSRGTNQRRKKFRKKTDPMPLQVRSGCCFRVGDFGQRGVLHAGVTRCFYNCQVSMNGLKIRGRLPGKAPEGRVLEGVSITRRAGRWWASIKVETPKKVLPAPISGTTIGIDVGLEFIAAMSDGRRVRNNRGKAFADRIAGLQQRCAIYREQGRPTDKLERTTQRLAESAARHTRHEIYNKVLKPLECVETIKIEALPPHIGQMGSTKVSVMRLVRELLLDRYGARDAKGSAIVGGRVREVAPHYTSQECSQCGYRSKDSWSYEHGRVGQCPACGFRCDRDVNAARNIASKPVESLCS